MSALAGTADIPIDAASTPRGGWASIVVLSLGFGLLGIDRFLINTMFPVIARDLHLNYSDIGTITGALAISWGLSALVMGNLSDRIGARVVLVGSLILFSLLIGASGLAEGLGGLVMVRIVMGFADGAFSPAASATTMTISRPGQAGRNIGIQLGSLSLFGLGFAPLLVGALLGVMGWRYIFSLFVIPGFLIAWLIRRNVPAIPRTADAEGENILAHWRAVLRYRNVRLLMASMLCWLTCMITVAAFFPNYLIDHLRLSSLQMGIVMSSMGFGAAIGNVLLNGLSDRIGRRPVFLIALGGGFVSFVLLAMTGANVPLLFAELFMTNFFMASLMTLTMGSLAAESVPVRLMATSAGMVMAAGELFGGGVAPIIGGVVADTFGIAHILWLPFAALLVGFVIWLFIAETLGNQPQALLGVTPAGDQDGKVAAKAQRA